MLELHLNNGNVVSFDLFFQNILDAISSHIKLAERLQEPVFVKDLEALHAGFLAAHDDILATIADRRLSGMDAVLKQDDVENHKWNQLLTRFSEISDSLI